MFSPKKTKDDSNIREQEMDRQRSFTMVNPMSQSTIETKKGKNNRQNIEIFNLKLKQKEQYKRQTYCTVCFSLFTTMNRQHHCRACANAVCKNCCTALVNNQKACDICYMRYSNIGEQQRKKQIINNLQTLCALTIYKKKLKAKELKQYKAKQKQSLSAVVKAPNNQDDIIKSLEQELAQVNSTKSKLAEKLSILQSKSTDLEQRYLQLNNL